MKNAKVNEIELKQFIYELEYNQKINFLKNLENRIDIDYVIDRLKDCFKK